MGAALLYYIVFLFTFPYLYDESYYVTIPHRIIKGDSLISEEWHLSQFSSVFTFLPVLLWTTLTGSTDGIIVFLRCVYLLLHTCVAVIVYKSFRRYSVWAVFAALIFYTQTPYRLLAVSYNSVFVLSLLLFTLCLLKIYGSPDVPKAYYIVTGIFFGCCCVCNPLFVLSLLVYFTIGFVRLLLKLHSSKKTCQKYKSSADPLFSKKALLYSFLGTLFVALITLLYFFLTGGTFSSIREELSCMLSSSEYALVSGNLKWKLLATLEYFSTISLKMPFLIPLLFTALIFDKKRKNNIHRCIYLAASLIIATVYIVGIVLYASYNTCAFALPFAVVSVTCYILTNNKNKPLFYCMWLVCALAAVLQYTAANTHLTSVSIVLSVSNVAGVLFAKDLFSELSAEDDASKKKTAQIFCRTAVCIGLCFQLIFHVIIIQYDQLPKEKATAAADGPYAGICMTEKQYTQYCAAISDLNTIKERSSPDDPVLIATYHNWMYLELDRPYSVYTTWYRGRLIYESLILYYEQNPHKIPKYIYVDERDYYNDPDPRGVDINFYTIDEMFSYTEEKLEGGILLTVTDYKFD